jgi:hypothetical protein
MKYLSIGMVIGLLGLIGLVAARPVAAQVEEDEESEGSSLKFASEETADGTYVVTVNGIVLYEVSTRIEGKSPKTYARMIARRLNEYARLDVLEELNVRAGKVGEWYCVYLWAKNEDDEWEKFPIATAGRRLAQSLRRSRGQIATWWCYLLRDAIRYCEGEEPYWTKPFVAEAHLLLVAFDVRDRIKGPLDERVKVGMVEATAQDKEGAKSMYLKVPKEIPEQSVDNLPEEKR